MKLIIHNKIWENIQEIEISQEIAFIDAMEKVNFDGIIFWCMSWACWICKVLVEEWKENIEYFQEPLVVDKDSNEVLTCIAKIVPRTKVLIIKLII